MDDERAFQTFNVYAAIGDADADMMLAKALKVVHLKGILAEKKITALDLAVHGWWSEQDVSKVLHGRFRFTPMSEIDSMLLVAENA